MNVIRPNPDRHDQPDMPPVDDATDPGAGDRDVAADDDRSRGDTTDGERPASDFKATEVVDSRKSIGDAVEVKPSSRAPIQQATRNVQPIPGSADLPVLTEGGSIDDFEIVRVLGRGAFGIVYLARQLSLNRQVALKMTANRNSEGRTMARLEHDHIVQVFSESPDASGRWKLLCMQYVPGTTLEDVLTAAMQQGRSGIDGPFMLEIIDRLNPQPVAFDPAGYRDRTSLGECDPIDTVCWLGSRLADALDFAHRQGVLHRDIKPANILQSQYGRPLLADFNLSVGSAEQGGPSDSVFGGTLAWMSPEHLRAFDPDDPTAQSAVDRRSDLYSLAIVLFQLSRGRLPFPLPDGVSTRAEALGFLTAQRNIIPDAVSDPSRMAGRTLDRIIRRCLDPVPDQRWQFGGDLADALEGCRSLNHIEQRLPQAGPVTRRALQRPVAVLGLVAVLPHAVGSIVNIAYNLTRIRLYGNQSDVFGMLVNVYNAIVWPVCLIWLWRSIVPVLQQWQQHESSDAHRAVPIESTDAHAPGPPGGPLDVPVTAPSRNAETGMSGDEPQLRRRVLCLPRQAGMIALVGWIPGIVFFPMGLDLFSNVAVSWGIYLEFAIDLTLCCLIALTYSVFGVQYLTLRVFYPRLWNDPRMIDHIAREELAHIEPAMTRLQILSGAIPLAGAVLLLSVGAAAEFKAFRLLVIALIILGMIGFQAAIHVRARVSAVVRAFSSG